MIDEEVFFLSAGDLAACIRRGHQPAVTTLCCQMIQPAWKIEIDAVAAKAT